MILGFAHVVYGVWWKDGEFSGNYGIPSSSEKWPFMVHQARKHDLVVNFPGIVPIELVKHDTGFARVRPKIIIRGRGYIEVLARDRQTEFEFLLNFGVYDNNLISVMSPVKKWKVDIGVITHNQAPYNPPLDIEGAAALAFYSTDVEEDIDMMVEAGCKLTSNPFAMTLNGRDMLVAMARSPEGTIIELIQIRKKI